MENRLRFARKNLAKKNAKVIVLRCAREPTSKGKKIFDFFWVFLRFLVRDSTSKGKKIFDFFGINTPVLKC